MNVNSRMSDLVKYIIIIFKYKFLVGSTREKSKVLLVRILMDSEEWRKILMRDFIEKEVVEDSIAMRFLVRREMN